VRMFLNESDRALTQLRGVLAGSCHGLHPLSEWALRQTRYGSQYHSDESVDDYFYQSPNAMAQTRLLSFDDFSQESRLVLIYARGAVSESGGAALTPDHLLLGILRGAPDVIGHVLRSSDSTDVLAQQVLATMGTHVRIHESVEIPIAPEVEHILVNALGKARATTSKIVRPEHILLALLEISHTKAMDVLRIHGITEEIVAASLRE
jgi:hypothetical protein